MTSTKNNTMLCCVLMCLDYTQQTVTLMRKMWVRRTAERQLSLSARVPLQPGPTIVPQQMHTRCTKTTTREPCVLSPADHQHLWFRPDRRVRGVGKSVFRLLDGGISQSQRPDKSRVHGQRFIRRLSKAGRPTKKAPCSITSRQNADPGRVSTT